MNESLKSFTRKEAHKNSSCPVGAQKRPPAGSPQVVEAATTNALYVPTSSKTKNNDDAMWVDSDEKSAPSTLKGSVSVDEPRGGGACMRMASRCARNSKHW